MKFLQSLWNFYDFLLSLRKAFPEKFSFIPITNQFLRQFEIFDFFIKVAKFEFGPILEVNFWKTEFLEASSPNFPWSSPESLSGSAKIISWTFGIRKKIHWKYWKSAKIGGSLKIFQNLGPCNSRWSCSNVSASGNMKHTSNAMWKDIFNISRALVQYRGAENEIKWKNKNFLSFSQFLRRNNIQ